LRLHLGPTLSFTRIVGLGLVALALAGCSRKVPYAIPVLNNLKVPVIVGICTDAACKDVKGSVILGPGDGYNQPADGSSGAVTWLVLRHPYDGRLGCIRSVANGKSTATLVRTSNALHCPASS
jgi:hypothetical protein